MTPSLPSCIEGELHRQDRAERVAVGVLVGGDDETVVRPDRIGDRRKSAFVCVSVWGELIDELGEPHPFLYRRIVLKAQLGSSLQMELLG